MVVVKMKLFYHTFTGLGRRLGRRNIASNSVSETLKQLTDTLNRAGLSEPHNSARHLVAGVLNCKSVEGKSSWQLDSQQVEKLKVWTECRLARMPVQYILKEWDFRDLTLKMVPPVFIPRPETEELVELILKHLKSASNLVELCEIGCGSGAISLSLKKAFPKMNVTAVDQSSAACLLCEENAHTLKLTEGLKIVQAKLKDNGQFSPDVSLGQLDLVVSNPPYILRKDMMKLAPEIALYEDLRALDGGKDGLETILPILKLSDSLLKKESGLLFLEIDPCHFYLLPEALNQHQIDLRVQSWHKDFNGHHRFVILQK